MAKIVTDDRGLRFRTRNYKHELRLAPGGRHSILDYTDEIWEILCSQIAAHDFNGLVLYTGYHPFENFLEYDGFEDVITVPAEQRAAVREKLRRGLAIAHKYGLKTFIQHYLSHFPRKLADKYNIHVQGRLSNVDHPEVDRYVRYCYRATFDTLPDLDGLYFNYESAPNNWQHILRTAIPEFNAMQRKPIMVYRLWDFTSIDGMRELIKAYKGRVILGHKIPDTNDTYYLPSADSRVMEWKKRLSKDIEWMFLVGPCHNCGTNLCSQLWGDYDFVWDLLEDAQKKGADSISFHTINDFFAPDMPASAKVFSESERRLARFNRMHLEAVVDYVHGRRKTSAQRAAALVGRVGVDPKAGRALSEAIEASSQLVLLAYQQFCFTSAAEGYRHRGFISHIQEPFMHIPATELNHQATRIDWGQTRTDMAWLAKTIDTVVAPDDFLQYIIDYVDPSKPKATRNPKKIADLLEKNIQRANAAFKQYRRLAGADAAAELEPYLRENEAAGEFVRRQILAAIHLYSIYFANGQAAVETALRKGLAELQQAQKLMDSTDDATRKSIQRVYLFNKMPSVQPEIDMIRRTLDSVRKRNFPIAAYRAYMESRRLYNEIRRTIRPSRRYDHEVILNVAVPLLEASMVMALQSLSLLDDPKHVKFADNVRLWLEYLGRELAHTRIPAITCPSEPSGQYDELPRHHGFRYGESFAEDLLGFFEPMDYLCPGGLRFETWHTADELVVTLREEGVSTKERFAWWEQCKDDTGSLAFMTRVLVDTANEGKKADMFVVWPKGSAVSLNKIPAVDAPVEFTHGDNWWQVTLHIPFKLLGKTPAKGETWGLNVTANPSIRSTRDYSWAPQYDATNPKLFGKVTFT